jgi:hypothetical protein
VSTPTKGRLLLKSLQSYVQKHGAALGIAEVVMITDLELVMLEAERRMLREARWTSPR